jgi:hypothetical protein
MANLITLPPVSESELATILHGLRLIQENANGPGDCVGGVCEHFVDDSALTDTQIDSLCERLNADGTPDKNR